MWKLAEFSKKYKTLPQGPSHLLPCSSLPRGPQPRSWRCVPFMAEGPFICVCSLTSFLNSRLAWLHWTLGFTSTHLLPPVFSETVNVLTGWCSLRTPWTPLSPWPRPSGPSAAPAQTISWNCHFPVSALLVLHHVSFQSPHGFLTRLLGGPVLPLFCSEPLVASQHAWQRCREALHGRVPVSAPPSVPPRLTGLRPHWPAAVPSAPDQAPPSGALSLLSPRPGLFPENPH